MLPYLSLPIIYNTNLGNSHVMAHVHTIPRFDGSPGSYVKHRCSVIVIGAVNRSGSCCFNRSVTNSRVQIMQSAIRCPIQRKVVWVQGLTKGSKFKPGFQAFAAMYPKLYFPHQPTPTVIPQKSHNYTIRKKRTHCYTKLPNQRHVSI